MKPKIFLLFIFFIGCQSIPILDDKEINKMGTEAFQKIKSETPIEKDQKINQYVKCIAEKIIQASQDVSAARGEWEIVVFKSEQVNAFALPGRKIGVYTALLNVAKNQDQLAAVLGHEVAHVTKKHGKERVQAQVLTMGGMQVLGAILGNDPNIMGALGVGAQYGVVLPYGRSQETEADLVGLELMAKAGFHPEGAIQLWENMKKLGGRVPEILSTHPAPETRIQQLKQNLTKPMTIYQIHLNQGTVAKCN